MVDLTNLTSRQGLALMTEVLYTHSVRGCPEFSIKEDRLENWRKLQEMTGVIFSNFCIANDTILRTCRHRSATVDILSLYL